MIFGDEPFNHKITDILHSHELKLKTTADGVAVSSLHFILDGDSAEIKQNSGKKIPLSKGAVLFIPSDTAYKCRSLKLEQIIIYLSCEFDSAENQSFTPINPQKYFQLFKRAFLVWEQKHRGYRHEAEAILSQIIAECVREGDRCEEKDASANLNAGFAYITDNLYSVELKVTDGAKAAGVSEVYFRRAFHKKYGVSPKKYITESRLTRVKELKSTGFYSKDELAKRSGFADKKYLSAEYLRFFGEKLK